MQGFKGVGLVLDITHVHSRCRIIHFIHTSPSQLEILTSEKKERKHCRNALIGKYMLISHHQEAEKEFRDIQNGGPILEASRNLHFLGEASKRVTTSSRITERRK